MIRNWPTAAVAIAVCVCIAATIVTGLALGVDVMPLVLAIGGEGIGGVLMAAAMRGMFSDDGGGS